MPQTLALGDVLRVKFHCYGRGQWTQNTIYYLVTQVTAASQTDRQVAVAVRDAVRVLYADCMSNQAQFYGVSVQRIVPEENIPAYATDPQSGNFSSIHAPVGLSYCIHLMTGLAGKTNRGRVFIPFIPVGELGDGQTPSVALVNALTALGSALIASITATTGGNSCRITPFAGPNISEVAKVFTEIRLARTFTVQESREPLSDGGQVPFAPAP